MNQKINNFIPNFDCPKEFSKIIQCDKCTPSIHAKLLRDDMENIPQPGYIGPDYWKNRILLIGQNPGTPKSLANEDLLYTSALRTLRESPTAENYSKLELLLQDFIPKWPVHGNYFPLQEAGLTLRDVAYFNVVRCRTYADAKPSANIVQKCVSNHFKSWIDQLSPRVVIYIGKWAADMTSEVLEIRGIRHEYINRHRSLSAEKRSENRKRVIQIIKSEK